MTEKRPTYETFALHQVIPAPGWHTVWWNKETQTHWTSQLFFLGLVNRTLRDAESALPIEERWSEHLAPEELREVVALEFADGTFDVADDCGNYCGLLPPDWTLADFEQHGNWRCTHAAPTPEAPAHEEPA